MVEWKKLGEVCSFNRGRTITAKDAVDGNIPVIAGGQTPSYCHNEANRNGESITIAGSGAYAGFISYWNQPIFVSDAFTVDPTKILKHKYLFHWLKKYQERIYATQKGAGVPHVHGKDIANFEIPIPSLSEQQRIVEQLDTFTSSIENLKEQIVQRRKQYEYYRDQLLDLEGKEGVEMKTLRDLFTFKNGLNKGKEYFGKGKPIIMFTNVFNSRSIDASMIKSRVDISDDELERINAKVGDVFFTRTSETREDVGYASVLIQDVENCTFAGFLIRARPTTKLLLPGYCKYCFSTTTIRKAIVNNSSFTTRASLTGGGLGNVILPIPSLSEQQRIVSILDTFEASINNLEQQLAQREKQYEYCRNKLLTFE